MAYKKCEFKKMKYRRHGVKANPEKTKKLIEDKQRRKREWNKWLMG